MDYIFASCKEWHKPLFDEFTASESDNWHWCHDPTSLKALLQRISPRFIFFFHWSWLVPEEIWVNHECVCFHMTAVPYGRGGTPLQNLIIRGHKVTKLTALQMEAGLDTGPVYTRRDLTLDGSAEEIYRRAGLLSADMVREIILDTPTPRAQTGEAVVFERRKPSESQLPSNASLPDLFDFIRMLDADSYPHAFIDYGNYRIQFREARLTGERLVTTAELMIKNTRDQ